MTETSKESGNVAYLRGITEALDRASAHANASVANLMKARTATMQALSDRDQVFRNMEHVRNEMHHVAAVLDAAESWYVTIASNSASDEKISAAEDAMFHAIHRWLGATL